MSSCERQALADLFNQQAKRDGINQADRFYKYLVNAFSYHCYDVGQDLVWGGGGSPLNRQA